MIDLIGAGIVYGWRWATDRRVRCVSCGDRIGYVGRRGHAAWACAGCSGTGRVEPAYRMRGWSWHRPEETPA